MTSPTIDRLEAIIVDLPTIRPHKLAMHTMQNQTLVIIRLRCADGIEGIGEATTIGGLSYGNESPDSMKVNIDRHFAPLLIGAIATPLNSWWTGEELEYGLADSGAKVAIVDKHGSRKGMPGRVAERDTRAGRRGAAQPDTSQLSLDF